MIDRTLPVTHNGEPREVTIEEALQHKTYQDAIAGNRAARREVLKMIAKREKWLAAKAPKKHRPVERLIEPTDLENANEALVLLHGRRRLSDWDIAEIKSCTRDAETLRHGGRGVPARGRP